MKKIFSFIGEYAQIIGVVLIIIVVFLYIGYRVTNVEKNGIVTVAKVLRYESASSGSDLFIEIYFGDKKYETNVNQDFQPGSFGKFFFVKISPEQPDSYPVFYGHKPVPQCIIDNVKYFKGWQDLPTCENYNQ